jgi:two-component system cell cycle sensor histidine kinase/response regulator CckA
MNADFLATRLDYIYFLYGAAFIVLAAFSSALGRNRLHPLPWNWLTAFGWIHGLHEWLEMVAPALGPQGFIAYLRTGLLLVSMLALFEFGRGSCRILRSGRVCSPSVYVPVLLLAGSGGLAGLEGLAATARYFVALPATLLVAASFAQSARLDETTRAPFRMAAICFVAYGVLAGLIPAAAPFFPASVINMEAVLAASGLPVQLLRTLAVTGLAAALWRVVLLSASPVAEREPLSMPLRIRSTVMALLIIVAATGLTTEHLGRYADQNLRRDLLARTTGVGAALQNLPLHELQGRAEDAQRPAYQNLVRQLTDIRLSSPEVRQVYLYALRAQTLVFFAASEPLAPEEYLAPGEIYVGDLDPVDFTFFETGRPYTIGPFHDRWGEWVSASAPVNYTANGGVDLAVGMDIAAADFRQLVRLHRLAGLGAGVLMILLMLDFFTRHHRLWSSALRLAESEADYRLLSQELERRVAQRTDQLAAANQALRLEIERSRAVELKYRTLTDQLPAITYTVNIGARPVTTFISPQVESLLGYTPAEWMNDDALWLNRVHEDDRARVRDLVARCDASGEPLDVEYRMLTRGGQARWFRSLHRYVLNPDGRPVSAHGVMLDITDRMAAAQALREAGERYRLLFAHSPVGVFHFDRNLRLTETNDRFVNILRSRREKLIGLDLNQLIDQSIVPTLRTALAGGEGYHEGHYRTTTSDLELWISLRAAPVYGDHQQIIGGVGIVEDLTERHRLEDEHLRTQKLESLGLLAGGLAHDFNNILTAVLGNISMLRGGEARTPAETQDILQDAERAALRARDLTQQLLTFAKGGAPVKRLVSVSELVREAAGFTVRGSASKCVYRLGQEVWPAEVDAGQITQVVQNLVINADQAMPEGGVITLEAENIRLAAGEVGPLPAGPYIRLRVADTGVGIPERYLGRIFDPYFTTKQKGSGLGLTMCFSIVQKHGGHITVDSKVGQGTTFAIYLPAYTAADATPHGDGSTEAPAAAGGRVLVMDDEATILNLTRRMLEYAGYEVETAADGEAAVRAFSRAQQEGRPFAMVILDLTVPGGLGGKETFQRLRRLQPEVCAIVSSGYSTDQIMAQFRSIGFAGVVPKPYTSRELLKALQDARQRAPATGA